MSFFEEKYKIKDWYGITYSLTAKEIYKRTLKDSKSDYYWFTSATQLVRVCNEPSFPQKYAVGIKLIILNCFANLELQQEYPSIREETDNEAVYSCYHSLPSTDDTAKKIKEKYLNAIITGITKYAQCGILFPIYVGTTYRHKVEEWKKAKFNEYVVNTEIDFDQLRETLYTDFNRMVRTAEEEGAFEKDDEEYRCEEMKKFWASIKFKDL